MNKRKWIEITSKINQTLEDEFYAEYNSPVCMWDNLLHDKFLSETEIDRIEFCMNELIRKGNHSGEEDLFKDLKKTIKKLRDF